jgi:hypothetical protein
MAYGFPANSSSTCGTLWTRISSVFGTIGGNGPRQLPMFVGHGRLVFPRRAFPLDHPLQHSIVDLGKCGQRQKQALRQGPTQTHRTNPALLRPRDDSLFGDHKNRNRLSSGGMASIIEEDAEAPGRNSPSVTHCQPLIRTNSIASAFAIGSIPTTRCTLASFRCIRSSFGKEW